MNSEAVFNFSEPVCVVSELVSVTWYTSIQLDSFCSYGEGCARSLIYE